MKWIDYFKDMLLAQPKKGESQEIFEILVNRILSFDMCFQLSVWILNLNIIHTCRRTMKNFHQNKITNYFSTVFSED